MSQPQTNTGTTRVEPVVVTTTVDASQDRAFTVFTDGLDSWWPASHHIGEQRESRQRCQEYVSLGGCASGGGLRARHATPHPASHV